MKNIKLFIIVSCYCLILLPCGCTRDIILESGEKPAIVVECILTQDSMQELRLSYAKKPSQKEVAPLIEAKATLTDMTDQQTIGDFIRGEYDIWHLEYTPVAGHKYRLDVKVDGYDDIYAEDYMVEDISFEWLAYMPFMSTSIVTFSTMDLLSDYPFIPSGIYYNVMNMPDFLWAYGYNIDETTGVPSVIEEICTDYPGIDNFNLSGRDYSSEDGVIFNSLEGYAMHKKFIRFPSDPQWDDTPANGTIYFTISGNFSNVSTSAYESFEKSRKSSFVRFMSVSEIYDTYLRDAFRNIMNQQSSDLTFIYARENSYSNIVGGRGLFATVAILDAPWWCNTSLIHPNSL